MKSKTLLLLLIFIAGLTSLQAKNVDIDQARKVAGNFLQKVYVQYSTGKHNENANLEDPYIFFQDGSPVFFAFNTNPGFIIISGDDVFTPVIGYSSEGRFELEGAPSNYRGFIQNYIDQIRYIRDQCLVANQDIKAAWDELSVDYVNIFQTEREGRDVAPLLISNWNQGSPYNLLCPEDPAGPGGHTYVGCVATAMAQIMYYYRYPQVGTGNYCYWPPNNDYGEQCADFGDTYYDWEGMNNGIDHENPYPNAELQFHCAVSVDMQFSPGGSGAYSYMVPERLAQYWGYNEAQYHEKDWYSMNEWIAILKNEIDNGRPLYYSGFNQSWEGHAFVCDGYQGDNFHFNFGWNGSGNGYFSLYNVGGFSEYQACVTYFAPSDPAYPYHINGNKLLTQKSGSLTDGSGPLENYSDNQNATWIIDVQDPGDSITDITLKFFQFDLLEGDTLKVYDGETNSDSLLGSFSGTTIPANVLSTGDKMLITFSTDGSGTSAGWYAEFNAHSAVYCNSLTELTEPSGIIEDGSGSYNYHDNSYCRWFIESPYASTITISFNQFDTEEGVDFVAVYDGTTQLGEFSGNQIPDPIVATSGSVLIFWLSNGNTSYQGWNAFYEVENVGIPENSSVHSINTYPNPASDRLNVQFAAEIDEPVEIRLVTLTGRVVLEQVIPGFEGSCHTILNVKEFPDGIYVLELESSSSKHVRKVVIR